MPLYEYECDSCGHRFEVIQKFSDPPLQTCPKCGASIRKLQSAPAFQFKGSGWYVTDYAKKEVASGGRTEDKTAKPGEKTTEKSEAPETGRESKKDSSTPAAGESSTSGGTGTTGASASKTKSTP
jgi:putative FmdB family regulatory protein